MKSWGVAMKALCACQVPSAHPLASVTSQQKKKALCQALMGLRHLPLKCTKIGAVYFSKGMGGGDKARRRRRRRKGVRDRGGEEGEKDGGGGGEGRAGLR